VALARALVNRPRLLLLDELLGTLDAKLREQMEIELISLQRGVGITFVFVTHAQPEALAHRIAVMRDGRVEQVDAPSRLYGFPVNRFVADFIGNCNMLPATVAEAGAHSLRLAAGALGEIAAPAAERAHAGQAGVLAIRPGQVHIMAPTAAHELKNHFTGRVRDLLYIGGVTTYVVELARTRQ